MPVVAAAVCPHPPLIVPELAAGAAGELDALRAACDRALARVLGAGPDLLALVGGGTGTRACAGPLGGTFAPWGVPVRVGAPGGDELPLSLLVGLWLVRRAAAALPPVSADMVATGEVPERCLRLGARIAGRSARVGLLVLGDGSACRGEKAPGYDDPRAPDADRRVADALAAGDPDALRELDPDLAAQLLMAGRAPWQVLAGAAAGRDWRGDLLYADAPYGVTYLVAAWEPR